MEVEKKREGFKQRVLEPKTKQLLYSSGSYEEDVAVDRDGDSRDRGGDARWMTQAVEQGESGDDGASTDSTDDLQVIAATPTDLLKGAMVFCLRGSEYEGATVLFPSKKKAHHWALGLQNRFRRQVAANSVAPDPNFG
jgi:hypothetical protein